MKKHIMFSAVLLACSSLSVMAQTDASLKLSTPKEHKSVILVSRDTVKVDYNKNLAQVAVNTNQKYTVNVAPEAKDMIQVKTGMPDLLTLLINSNAELDARRGVLTLTSADGSCSREIVVDQGGNMSASELVSDIVLPIASGVSNQAQPGQDINMSYDGKLNTLYHSPYSGTQFPVMLTYKLKEASHVDYVKYSPRVDGSGNGNFGNVKVYCATADKPNTFNLVTQKNLEQSSTEASISLGEKGVDNVVAVRIEVLDGRSNFASCAEMSFHAFNPELSALFSTYFEDALCTRLKPEVTPEMANKISNTYVRILVQNLLADPNYAQSKYRIGTFEAYETVRTLASRLKTKTYNSYENPTGIYFEQDKPVVLFVEGIGKDGVSLKIKNFGKAFEGEQQLESSYSLKNGVNVVNPKHRGNGYISYYTDDYKNAPKVKIHFAMATETGYFDAERGDKNADWVKLLANAKSDIIDFRTKRIQMAFPKARFKQYCPNDAEKLALLVDSTIYYEREVMGLIGKEPKNRQFARVVWAGFMFADNIGAAANDNSCAGWLSPGRNQFEPWGFGHELGHVNQLTPGLKWVGCGETTNNIYSAWVQHKLGNGYHRLESEVTGIDDYSRMRGGRFNTYLEENVRKGVSWQLADGSDYHGSDYMIKTVDEEDYAGKKTGRKVQVKTRNFDHFVKLAPLWQLQLYCHAANFSPNVYAKVMEGLRKADDRNMSNGMYQMRFMRMVCDSTQLDFLDFFEKAGMLRPINAFIEDYSAEWLKINEAMIQELRDHVAAKKYAKPQGEINYITADNWKIYRDKLKLTGAAIGEGCTVKSAPNNAQRIRVSHNVWKNVVAFETYDANGKLLRISMGGLCADAGESYSCTDVLWPQTATEQSAYIMAVGWDGTRIKCYEKK